MATRSATSVARGALLSSLTTSTDLEITPIIGGRAKPVPKNVVICVLHNSIANKNTKLFTKTFREGFKTFRENFKNAVAL